MLGSFNGMSETKIDGLSDSSVVGSVDEDMLTEGEDVTPTKSVVCDRSMENITPRRSATPTTTKQIKQNHTFDCFHHGKKVSLAAKLSLPWWTRNDHKVLDFSSCLYWLMVELLDPLQHAD